MDRALHITRQVLAGLVLLGLLALPLLAWGQEGDPAPTSSTSSAPTGLPPELQYLYAMGPLGAAVGGAWLLAGKGIKITVDIRLSDEDRSLFRRAIDAVEELVRRRRLDAP